MLEVAVAVVGPGKTQTFIMRAGNKTQTFGCWRLLLQWYMEWLSFGNIFQNFSVQDQLQKINETHSTTMFIWFCFSPVLINLYQKQVTAAEIFTYSNKNNTAP